jgi:hypothetical protein
MRYLDRGLAPAQMLAPGRGSPWAECCVLDCFHRGGGWVGKDGHAMATGVRMGCLAAAALDGAKRG